MTNVTSQTPKMYVTDGVNGTETPHPYYALSQTLYAYMNPIIVIVGLFSNMLTLVVMRRPALKSSSVSVYFSVLAVTDSLVLLLDLMDNWINRLFSINIKGMSDHLCRGFRTLFSTAYTYSAWLVVCIVVERVIVVTFPFHAKRFCTTRIATVVSFIVLVLVFVKNCYHMFMWEVDINGSCHFAPQYQYFARYISQWVGSAFYSYIPFLILVICNSVLIRSLAVADKKRQDMSSNQSKGIAEKFIKTAVAVCVTYMLFTTPLSIFYTVVFSQGLFNYESPEVALADSFIGLIGISNYAVNFYLYILTSATFRRELKKVLCDRRFNSGKEDIMKSDPKISTVSSSVSAATSLAN